METNLYDKEKAALYDLQYILWQDAQRVTGNKVQAVVVYGFDFDTPDYPDDSILIVVEVTVVMPGRKVTRAFYTNGEHDIKSNYFIRHIEEVVFKDVLSEQ
jgi:hypothetical protein